MLITLEEADELHYTRVIDTSHDLDLFEDVGALDHQHMFVPSKVL